LNLLFRKADRPDPDDGTPTTKAASRMSVTDGPASRIDEPLAWEPRPNRLGSLGTGIDERQA
jgi:hypothetical protein